MKVKVMTMKGETDFSEGVRGKFHKSGTRLIPPVRLHLSAPIEY
jgi:hypothetical protein